MTPMEDVWLPLVDEPLGELISRIQAEDTQITALISSPRRQLAFRTFAYIRVGILLGELLLEREIDRDAAGTWVDQLLEDPAVSAAVLNEVREVAHEVVSDPRLASDEALGPDEAVRERFRDFVRRLETG
jgi:hypothetical protein